MLILPSNCLGVRSDPRTHHVDEDKPGKQDDNQLTLVLKNRRKHLVVGGHLVIFLPHTANDFLPFNPSILQFILNLLHTKFQRHCNFPSLFFKNCLPWWNIDGIGVGSYIRLGERLWAKAGHSQLGTGDKKSSKAVAVRFSPGQQWSQGGASEGSSCTYTKVTQVILHFLPLLFSPSHFYPFPPSSPIIC